MGNSEYDNFSALIARVRDGDQNAARKVISDYESQIRRLVRLQLTDPALRRILDSTDICQSVFATFFCRASMGEFELKTPGQLMALLSTMARNKLVYRYRKESVRRPRGGGTILYGDAATDSQVAGLEGSGPEKHAEARELLAGINDKLSDHERQLVQLRRDGLSWSEISSSIGEPADTLRKRLARACDRILRELGYGEEDA